jgi:hypothetical protein
LSAVAKYPSFAESMAVLCGDRKARKFRGWSTPVVVETADPDCDDDEYALTEKGRQTLLDYRFNSEE